ncbi:S-layer homology domain-containing protein [Paenibacillus sp. UNC451MF]|uniref:S-layer homology domain-containing protein n=1 Tax=Paenibacillus sp. UNC451MF TaxID=1449063 RepID=UPI00068D5E5B|nr:S-layer homology domain-containing protein [Paenibacillus sp. UNC451MF]
MFSKARRLVSSVLVSAVVLSTLPISPAVEAAGVTMGAVDTPIASLPGGRYDEPKSITLSTTTPGAEIYYTLDGMTPNDKSLKYDNAPIQLSKTSNLSVIAKKDGVYSKTYTYGYIIKTKEKPLLQFVEMSDIHIGSHDVDPKYEVFFDTIASIFPKPDAIIMNGDMINDNGDHKGDDHKIVHDIFQSNLDRKGMDTTRMQVSIGNHDDSVAKVKEGYPNWFTEQANGYYETQIGGYYFFFLNGNNYNSDTTQRNWLKGRLAAITSDPANSNKPIFVNVHQPISNTVMDGQQGSNPNLNTDLKDYPQVVAFMGHSHLDINDDRSIYQKDFTSVNEGSMSYIEAEHGYFAATPAGLVSRFEFPVSQAAFVEIYPNRVEVDRVALNADFGDIYSGGTWSFNPQPPFNSSGAIAGEPWVIELKGSTNDEIKSNFKFTAVNRNKIAPAFKSTDRLSITDLDTVPKVVVPQAMDDQMVHHYEVAVTDRRTGQMVKSFNAFSDFYFSPVPNTMTYPLDGLQVQTKYSITVTAVDSYGNKSASLQETFTTGGTPPVLTPIDPATMWKQLVVDMNFDDNLSDQANGVTGLATAIGNVTYVAGKSNKAVSIPSGTTNYIDLGSRSDLKFGNGDFTVSFWHTGSLAGDQTVISNKDWNSGKNVGWYIGPATANNMTLNMANGTTRLDTGAGVGTEWHLFTIIVDRTNNVGKVYVDGVEKSSATAAGLGTSSLDTTYNIIIGADGKKGYAGASVTMDDLKIWKRTLSATEIKALSDSYKTVKLFTFEQLTALISQAHAFQSNASSVPGVSYPQDLLNSLKAQLAIAKSMTSSSDPKDIDNSYLELQWALDSTKAAVVYTFIPKTAFTVDSFSSYADNESALASNILDGSEATIWHSKYESPAADFPHWVILDTQNTQRFTGIRRTSRLSQTALEFPKDFILYASDNLADLKDDAFLNNAQNKAAGTFGNTWTGTAYKDFVALDKPLTGRYVKFVVTSTYNSAKTFTSMSEIDFTGETVPMSSNADLSDLKVNGETVPGFASNQYSYKLNVPYSTTVAEVTYKTADAKATVEVAGGNQLAVGDNLVTVNVKAQNGSAQQYTLLINRADQELATSADLLDLKLNGKTIDGFASDKLNYVVHVPNSTTVAEVTYNQADARATVTITGSGELAVGDNLIKVDVKGSDDTSKRYTVIVKRASIALSSNADLTDLKINGKTVPGFASNLLSYVMYVPIATPEAKVTYTLSDPKAAAVIVGEVKLSVGSNLILVHTTAEDGTVKQYAITVIRLGSTNNHSSSGGSSSPTPPVEVVPTPPVTETKPDKPEVTPTPEPTVPVALKDLAGHWAESNINRAIALGFIQGYPDETFQPSKSVTRAEFVVMLAHALKLQGEPMNLSFTDANAIGDWAKREIAAAVKAGIINGYEDGSFQPDQRISRAEMIVMIMRAKGLSSDSRVTSFADQSDIPQWAMGSIALAEEKGLVDGLPGNRFAPKDQANRAEAVVVLLRLIDKMGK